MRLGSARLGSARLGSARLGSARLGSARLGSARLGSARLGSARLGSARLGSAQLNYIADGLRRCQDGPGGPCSVAPVPGLHHHARCHHAHRRRLRSVPLSTPASHDVRQPASRSGLRTDTRLQADNVKVEPDSPRPPIEVCRRIFRTGVQDIHHGEHRGHGGLNAPNRPSGRTPSPWSFPAGN